MVTVASFRHQSARGACNNWTGDPRPEAPAPTIEAQDGKTWSAPSAPGDVRHRLRLEANALMGSPRRIPTMGADSRAAGAEHAAHR